MTKSTLYPIAIVFVLFLAACKSGGDAGESESSSANASDAPSFDNAGDELAYERCLEEIPEIQAEIESGEASVMGCAGVLTYAERLADHSDQRVLDAAHQVIALCGLDVPLAAAESELAEAEGLRAGDPEARITRQCSMASTVLGQVHDAFTGDERLGAMRTRIATLCDG